MQGSGMLALPILHSFAWQLGHTLLLRKVAQHALLVLRRLTCNWKSGTAVHCRPKC